MVVHPIGDRHVAMQAGGAPQMWPKVFKLVGRPELNDDPRFNTAAARLANWPALREVLGEWLNSFGSVEEAVTALHAERIPAVPMLTPEEIVAHPHMAARQAFPTVDHPVRGKVRVTATPFHLDGKPVHPTAPAPYRIGQHTHHVLTGLLAYPAARVDALHAAKAVTVA